MVASPLIRPVNRSSDLLGAWMRTPAIRPSSLVTLSSTAETGSTGASRAVARAASAGDGSAAPAYHRLDSERVAAEQVGLERGKAPAGCFHVEDDVGPGALPQHGGGGDRADAGRGRLLVGDRQEVGA